MIEYKDGYKYQLGTDYTHQLKVNPQVEWERDFLKIDINGLLTIKKGYAWDGPSGPTIDTKSSMRASLVHDALYQLMTMKVLPQSYRKYVDSYEFHDILLQDGMWWIRAKLWFNSVKKMAMDFAKPKNLRKMLQAP